MSDPRAKERWWRDRGILLAFGVVALAAGVRLVGLRWGLPEVYEEATPLRRAWGMWAWGTGRSPDLNPHFFNYPSLVIYLHAVVQGALYLVLRGIGEVRSTLDFLILYVIDPTAIITAGRLLNAAIGSATVLALWGLGRRAGGTPAAALAGVLLALNPLHVSRSQMIDVDVPTACFTTLALWLCSSLGYQPGRRRLLLTGAAIGLATSSKYTGAILGVPLVVALLQRARARGGGPSESLSGTIRDLGLATGGALVAFAVTSPFVVLDGATFWNHFSLERQHMRLGHFGAGAGSAAGFYLVALGSRVLGWPTFLLAGAGMITSAIARRTSWAITLLSFAAAFLVVIGSWSMRADHYLLPVVPVFAVFTARAILDGSKLARRVIQMPGWVPMLAATAACLGPQVAGTLGTWGGPGADARTEAKSWIEAHVPPGALIVTEGHGPEFIDCVDLWTLEEEARKRILTTLPRPVYAVQTIPMFQVGPERSAAFYDPRLYEMADLVITSSAVRGRYEADPERFRAQTNFYRELERTFLKVGDFPARRAGQPGITVYRHPAERRPFGRRGTVAPPVPVGGEGAVPTGTEARFYYNFGLNYEAFGYYGPSLAAFRLALRYPSQATDIFGGLVSHTVRCLLATGRGEEAMKFLAQAEAGAPSVQERGRIRAFRRDVEEKLRLRSP